LQEPNYGAHQLIKHVNSAIQPKKPWFAELNLPVFSGMLEYPDNPYRLQHRFDFA
jgi:hypothetical protein